MLRIIGAGLAGSEAAYQAAMRGIEVQLYEMRDGTKTTNAHITQRCAELVCSNSFRNDDVTSAIGLLHEEMRRVGSLVMRVADNNKVPAGSALAVDRENFSAEIERTILEHPKITVIRSEVTEILPSVPTIIATGPLTSDVLTSQIIKFTGEEQLAFFDAIAPILYKESIDFTKCWYQSRYDKVGPGGDGKDYINCPMDKEQYYNFIDALIKADKTEFKQWEKDTPYFNGCLPIEVMAERGPDTLRFGPMKPVGLTNPHSDQKPYAVVQLRQDNKLATLYNIVGFQTKLKYAEQEKIFRTIPGLENAEFARLGGLHRNTFIKSPTLLDNYLRLKTASNIRFAGQITGVEGYVESATIGMLAGIFAAQELQGIECVVPPHNTALGALLRHITGGAHDDSFQPMNINFGLFDQIHHRSKKERGALYSTRALDELDEWIHRLKSK